MITNLKNKKVGYWGRVMALPLSLLLFSFIALKAQKAETPEEASTEKLNTSVAIQPITVVIDAAHGGTASGALSNDKNVYEKDINLAIANKIAALAPSYNINIVLTRNNDNTITAQDRIAFMNSVPYDLLVSIHVNASNISREPKPDYPNKSGFEVYVSRNNTSSSDKSELLARHIITKLEPLYTTNNKTKIREYESIYILDKGQKPSALVECGYINNNKDLAYITNPTNQENIAKKILEGIVAYSNSSETSKSLNISNGDDQDTKNYVANDTVPKKVLKNTTLTFKRPDKKSPNQKEWDSWKDEKTYGVWLDGKRIKNEVLNNHTPNEFSWYMVSKLAKNAINYGNHYYQIDLYSHSYFKKEFPEETKTISVQSMHTVFDTVILSAEAFQAKLNNNEAEKKKAKLELKNGQCYLKIKNDPHVYTVSMNDLNVYEKTKKGGNEIKSEYRDLIFTKTEVEAQFEGGINAWGKFLRENLIYPKEAIAKNIQGTIIVQFIVDKEGKLSDVKTLGGDPLLCEEAIRVVKNSSGKWLPALQNNHIVKAYKKQPIVFILDKQASIESLRGVYNVLDVEPE